MMKKHLEEQLDNALEMYDEEVLKNIQLKKQYEIMKANAEFLIEKNDELSKKNKKQDEEMERLNNNWNKLEEWLNIQQNISSPEQILNNIFNKLQELKESDKE